MSKKVYRATFADGSFIERTTDRDYGFAWKATPPNTDVGYERRPQTGFSAAANGSQVRTFKRAGWSVEETTTEQVAKRTQKVADRIDGYDRDDLGESLDY